MIRLIVGLGNPGKAYAKTRHNVGTWFVEQCCQQYQAALRNQSALKGRYTTCRLTASLMVKCFIPTTFMNDSGYAVSTIVHYYKLDPAEILIVHDELDFQPGVARLKWGGGAGGHNGLIDIIKRLKTHDFWRLRFGIGHPGEKRAVSQYVLNTPLPLECQYIQSAIHKGISILEDMCIHQNERAVNVLH